MEPHCPITSTQRVSVLLGRVLDIILNVAIQISRKFLFIDPKKKVVICVAFVILLSLVGSLTTLNNNYYLVQKHSVFNQYGVKLGWMWTCLVIGPFIWFSSRAHYRDRDKAVIDLLRLAVATFCWYISVWLDRGGVWIRGFDFSGHCFLMIYSMLVMAEEAHAFREWDQILLRDYSLGLVIRMRQERRTRYVQYCVVGMLILNIVWVAGTLVAVFCWFITYHKLYPAGFLQSPIQRVKDKRNSIR
ncbi:hypothetical protein DICVIV_02726 [Dictyocaulus viviparus]|uniref:Uncharacterized protein n=1 Tax=Dictyocaulus viviparus TaxID=29172 RepID=A0A0D8Y4X2_DICVI|nr:hypothetical protein DICVIV_02726 [Dictyocaulus viviparus]